MQPQVMEFPLPKLGEIGPGIERVAVSRDTSKIDPSQFLPAGSGPVEVVHREPKRWACPVMRAVFTGAKPDIEGETPYEVTQAEADELVAKWGDEKRNAQNAFWAETNRADAERYEADRQRAQEVRERMLAKIAEATGLDPQALIEALQ